MQKWCKDIAKILTRYWSSCKNEASCLGLYNTYIPQTGFVHFCAVPSTIFDFCAHFCAPAKILQKKFAPAQKRTLFLEF